MGLFGCGANLMGFYGVVVAAVWDLWGSMGCCGCGVGLMGLNYGAMGAYGDFQDLVMGLWRQLYGDLWGCCGCGAGPMGIYGIVVAAAWGLWGHGADLWVSMAAGQTLWESMGWLWLRCGTYGNLWGCCGYGVGLMV